MFGNVVALLAGLILFVGGAYLIYFWWGPFLAFLKGGIGLVLLFLGFLFAVFGYTGVKDEIEERRRERELKEMEEKEAAEAAATTTEEEKKEEEQG